MKTLIAMVFLVSVFVPAIGLAQQPAVPQDSFFDSNGVRIRYVDQGRPEFLAALREFLAGRR